MSQKIKPSTSESLPPYPAHVISTSATTMDYTSQTAMSHAKTPNCFTSTHDTSRKTTINKETPQYTANPKRITTTKRGYEAETLRAPVFS